MSDKRTFTLAHEEARKRAIEAIKNAPDGYAVVVREPTRNLDQNAAMWPILEAFSRQKTWPVNGELIKLSRDEWKDILTAAFKKESQRIAKGIDGGMVLLGQRTSKFSKKEFSDWLEFLHAAAIELDVEIY